jgi:hypothetical protein
MIMIMMINNNNNTLPYFTGLIEPFLVWDSFTSVPYIRITPDEYEVDIYIVYLSELLIILMITIQRNSVPLIKVLVEQHKYQLLSKHKNTTIHKSTTKKKQR